MIAALLAIAMLCATVDCEAQPPTWPGDWLSLTRIGTITKSGRVWRESAAAPPTSDSAPQSEGDPWLGPDKLRHFLAAFAATGYAHAGLRALDVDADGAVIGGVAFAMAASIGKEVYDVRVGRVFSLKDLAWDLAGTVVGALLVRAAR
jgi:uncharacterized protein YfiM (DUF2279 family)